MTKRTDIHTLRNFEPAAYDYVLSFSMAAPGEPGIGVEYLRKLRESETFASVGAAQGSSSICDICGAWFRHGDVWRHRQTGEHITLGHTCADKFDMAADRSEWKNLRGAAINRAKRRAELRRTVRELREQLRGDRELARALRCGHHIVRDMVNRALRYGTLSPKQAELAKKLAREEAAPRAPELPAMDVPEGRQELTGTLVSVQWREGYYGGALKGLLVVEREGYQFKVWGTIPGSADPKRGDRVTFTATVERSQDDPAFGFWKRPTKFQVVDAEEARECEGHPAGPFDPMGQTVYCDGSCR